MTYLDRLAILSAHHTAYNAALEITQLHESAIDTLHAALVADITKDLDSFLSLFSWTATSYEMYDYEICQTTVYTFEAPTTLPALIEPIIIKTDKEFMGRRLGFFFYDAYVELVIVDETA